MPFSIAQVSLLSILLSTVLAWPNPEPCNGDCEVHDPSVVRRDDGTYFLFGSAPNVSLKTAQNITGPWTSNPSGVFAGNDTQLGAPDVHKVGDTYWMYYQRTQIGTQASNISVASSPDMTFGSWVDHGLVDIPVQSPARNYNRIDPNLLVLQGQGSSNPNLYLSFGSFFDDIYQLHMLNTTTVDQGSFSHLEENVTTADISTTRTGRNPSEGSYQFAWPLDKSSQTTSATKYYLFWSSGNCCHTTATVPLGDEYKIMVCMADSPTGPFLDRSGNNCLTRNGGTMILGTHDNVYAPGGEGVMYDESLGSVVLYYHYLHFDNQTAPAVFGWNYLAFDSAGWPFVTTSPSNSTLTSTSSPTSSSAPTDSTASSSASTTTASGTASSAATAVLSLSSSFVTTTRSHVKISRSSSHIVSPSPSASPSSTSPSSASVSTSTSSGYSWSYWQEWSGDRDETVDP